MTRTCRLYELKEYFPICPVSSPAVEDDRPPIHLGKDLENRLATFALGYGAVSARFELVGSMPTLIAISAEGIERRTALSGSAAEWHRALDQMAWLYDEDVRAGLHRFLRARHREPQAKTREPEVKRTNRNFEQLLLMAA